MMVNRLPNRIFKKKRITPAGNPILPLPMVIWKADSLFYTPYEAFDLREQGGSPLFLPL